MDPLTSNGEEARVNGEAKKAEAFDIASAPSEDFYSGAVNRIRGFMVVIALVLTAAAWWRFGRWSALGFALGCAIAYLNFHWLKNGVSGLADRVTNPSITDPPKPQSGKGIVVRFLLRYVLLAVAAYVILTSFPASLRGLFAGLCLPVGAIACEASYELYRSF
ncbi:MAG TPA: ATP synthase subunit I [Candidatus Sulfotelmatobacter sp.]